MFPSQQVTTSELFFSANTLHFNSYFFLTNFLPLFLCISFSPTLVFPLTLSFHLGFTLWTCVSLFFFTTRLPCMLQAIKYFAKDYSNDSVQYSTTLGVLPGNCSGRSLKLKWSIFCKIGVLLLYKLYALLPSLELQLLLFRCKKAGTEKDRISGYTEMLYNVFWWTINCSPWVREL